MRLPAPGSTPFPYTTLFRSAAAIAAAYNKDKVVNLLEVEKPRQIKIRTRIAEVSLDAIKHLGLKWFGSGGEVRYSAAFLSPGEDRKSTRLNSSHTVISYAVF